MHIGETAHASDVSARVIRHCHATGLIPAAGHRSCGSREVQILRFIRRARDLGFPVERIADLLALWSDRSRHSADVKRRATEQSAGLRRRIAETEAMVTTLGHMSVCCTGDAWPDCPILNDLETTTPVLPPVQHPTTFGRG